MGLLEIWRYIGTIKPLFEQLPREQPDDTPAVPEGHRAASLR